MNIEQIDIQILKHLQTIKAENHIEYDFEVYKVISIKKILYKINNRLKRRQLSFRIFKLKELNLIKVRRPEVENTDLLAIVFTSEGDEIVQSIE